MLLLFSPSAILFLFVNVLDKMTLQTTTKLALRIGRPLPECGHLSLFKRPSGRRVVNDIRHSFPQHEARRHWQYHTPLILV